MQLTITQLDIILLPMDKLYLPEHPGSTLRGAFGHGLRELTCHNKSLKCEKCTIKDKCPYSLFFNPFLTEKEKEKTSGRFHNKPRPFVFEFDSPGKTEFNIGEQIIFKLNIFGRMVQYLPYIIESWRLLQKEGLGKGRGEFILKEIWLNNPLIGKAEKIYDYKTETIINKDISITSKDIKSKVEKYTEEKVELIITAPTLIKYENSFIKGNLDFHVLMKNLFRRLSSLAAFYGEEMDIVFDDYLKKAELIKVVKEELEWKEWYRYSKRQNKKIDMQGIKGKISYSGPHIADFIEYLIYGQFIHIGKNTVFGQGKYIIL